jgi:DNA-binding SARP family transcriptional activator
VEPVVFREKVRKPEPSGLSRERLERLLLDDAGPTTTLLLAPAGSGKTTLLGQVAASPRHRTAWYRAGPEDDTHQALVRHLAHALAEVLPDPDELLAEPAVDALIVAVERSMPSSAQLIVDDVHELAGTAAEAALERFIELRPRQLRVLLGSRRPLALNLPRLVVSGDLRVLDGDDLRFRSWEVEELFRAVHQRPLPPEAAAALTRRTGGWAAGLQLFHLATVAKPDSERVRAARELGGRSRLVRAYLTRNVLAELDPERREFLLTTSTLGRLTGTLCDRLLQRTGSAAVLEELERQQFFTTSAEDGSSYRYHQVLQSHLEGMLIDELGPAASRDLHSASGRLLESDGYPREAIRAYALADDWASVARLLQHGNNVLPAGGNVLTGWPDDDPWLALAQARRLLRSGSIEPAVTAYRRAESLLDDPEFQARCADERALASVWAPSPAAGQTGEGGDPVRRIAEALRRATRRVPAEPTGHPLVDAVARLLAGDPDAARQALGRLNPAAERSWLPLCAQLVLVVANLADADWDDAVAPLEEVALSAELEDQPWLARVARGLQAAVLRSTKPESWRADGSTALADDCVRDGDHWGALLITLSAAAAELRGGDDEAARQWFALAGDRAAGLGATVVEAWSAIFGAVASARQGSADAADRLGVAVNLARTAGTTEAYPVLDQARRLLAEPVAARAAVRVRCLGGFAADLDGAPVELPGLRPRARQLLLLLAIHHGRDVHRERLIDALWPDAPPAAGTHRLQVAASNVRQCLAAAGLGDQTVRRHADAYRLELPGAWFDLARFEELSQAGQRATADGDSGSALGHWSAALELYAGELLPEVGPAEWVLTERERLRICATEAALGIAGLTRDDNPAEAVRAAQRAVELDPLRDTSWLLLAELQESAGDPTAAAATRREHDRVYAELVSPSPPGPDGRRVRA